MRILTVRQPWAWAIIHGGKSVENRVRNLAGDYRGPVAIHAGLQFDDASWDDPVLGAVLDDLLRRRVEVEFTPGAIIGVVDLDGVHEADSPWCNRDSLAGADASPCSDWAEPDVWHLMMANARPLATPIPYRGALGLRTLPADVIAAINAQVTS